MFQSTLSLTVDNAKIALDCGLQAIKGGQTEIDLTNLAAVDSAAVATLLAWRRAAFKHGVSLTFKNIPANLHSLAELYGVHDLLTDALNK